jgi:hypothetical protein
VAGCHGDASGAKKIPGAAAVTCRNSPEVVEGTEHALDGVEVAIEEWQEAVLLLPGDSGRDVGQVVMFLDFLAVGRVYAALRILYFWRSGTWTS